MKQTHRILLLTLTVALICASAATAKIETFDLDKTYSIAPDGYLYLDSDDAEVTITGSDRTDVRVIVHYRRSLPSTAKRIGDGEFEVTVTEDNGNLRIQEAESGGIVMVMGTVRTEYTIQIEAPSSVSLRVKGDDDEYTVRNFSGDLRLDIEDGEAVLHEMTGSRFELSAEDGEIRMQGGSGLLDATVEDGDIHIEGGSFSDVSARAEDGTIEVETALVDSGRYRMRAEDGEIALMVSAGGGRFTCDFDDGSTRTGSSFKQVKDEEGYEEYELPGGKADIRLEVEDGRITLRSN